MRTAFFALLAVFALGPSGCPAGEFQEEMKARSEATDDMTVQGKNGWLFLRNELRHIGVGRFWGEHAQKTSRATDPDQRDPLPVIVDVNKQLEELGCTLIVVPVPPKAFCYPEYISDRKEPEEGKSPARLDEYHQEFYRILREAGVEVVDLMPEFLSKRTTASDRMYCKTDTHYSPRACVLVAQMLAEKIKAMSWYAAAEKKEYGAEEKEITVEGDLSSGGGLGISETLSARFVSTKDGGPVEPDVASPVTLMADSHGLIFSSGGDMLTAQAGIADQLAFELSLPVDVIATRGSAATSVRKTLYRRSKNDPDYIEKRKVVIWLFAAREFTESTGWAAVPVRPK